MDPNRTSRARSLALAVSVVVGLVLTLTGCGDGEDNDGNGGGVDGSTTEQACRTYLLTVGGQDQPLVSLLSKAADSGSYYPDDLTALLDLVVTAAGKAGATDDLADADFERYLAVAEAARSARTAVTAEDVGLDTELVSTLDDAVGTVRKACGQ